MMETDFQPQPKRDLELSQQLEVLPSIEEFAHMGETEQAVDLFTLKLTLASQIQNPAERSNWIDQSVSGVGQLENRQQAVSVLDRGAQAVQVELPLRQRLEVLPSIVEELARIDETKRAVSWFTRTLDSASQIQNPAEQSRKIDQIISGVGQLENRQQAVSVLDRGAQDVQADLPRSQQLEVLPSIVEEFTRMGETEQAADMFTLTLDSASRIQNPAERSNRIDQVISNVGQLENRQQAVSVLDRGAQDVQVELPLRQQLEVLPSILLQFARMGETEQAVDLFTPTLDLAPQIQNPAERSNWIDQVISGVGQLENRQQAVSVLDQGAQDVQVKLLHSQQLEVLPSIILQFARLGETERAANLFTSTLSLTSQIQIPAERSRRIDQVISDVGQENKNQARALLSKGARTALTWEPDKQLDILPDLTKQFVKLNDPQPARILFDQMLEMSSQVKEPELRLRAINQCSTTAGLFKDEQQAISLLTRTTDRALESLEPTQLIKALPQLAIQSARVGDSEQAKFSFARALEEHQDQPILRQAITEALDALEPAQALQVVPIFATQSARAGDTELSQSIFEQASNLLPQFSPLEQIEFLTGSTKAMVDVNLHKSIELLDQAYQIARQSPDREKWKLIKEASHSMPPIEAFATAIIEGHSADSPLVQGQERKLCIKILKETLGGFVARPASISNKVEIVVTVWATGMDVLPHWFQTMWFYEGCDFDPLDIRLIPRETGHSQVEIEFFYQGHWLTQIKLDVKVVDSEM